MMISLKSSVTVAADLPLNFSPQQKHTIAQDLLAGETCKRNIAVVQAAYDQCAAKHVAPSIFGTPEFVIGEFVVTASLTLGIACLAHIGGMCQ